MPNDKSTSNFFASSISLILLVINVVMLAGLSYGMFTCMDRANDMFIAHNVQLLELTHFMINQIPPVVFASVAGGIALLLVLKEAFYFAPSTKMTLNALFGMIITGWVATFAAALVVPFLRT